MLLRLLMFLLVAGLALPAAAMPLAAAETPVASAHAQDCHGKAADHGAPGKARPAKHDCIGCIAPSRISPPAAEAAALRGLLAPMAEAPAQAVPAAAPEPPPPRS